VAAHLAQKYPARVSGLVMFVPYDRLASVAQSHYPVLPVYYLLRDRFAPVDWLKDYRGPVKIIIAGADEIIPPERGQKLYDGYPGPKSLQIIPGAGHGGPSWQSPQWWRATLSFLQSVHEH
jgi:pimeloyl-ACP methyl ester carboxylesterase